MMHKTFLVHYAEQLRAPFSPLSAELHAQDVGHGPVVPHGINISKKLLNLLHVIITSITRAKLSWSLNLTNIIFVPSIGCYLRKIYMGF